MTELVFRPAIPADAPVLGALIKELLPFLTLHPDGHGAEQFVGSIDAAAQARNLQQANFRYHVALHGEELAGLVAMRDNSHLYHLFVARALHGQGLGRKLWEHARDEALALGNPGSFTVNASDHALALYRHLGFVATAPRQVGNGIAWTPMRLG